MLLKELFSRSIIVNKRLNPKLWQDGDLDPQVTNKLLKIARAFEEFIGVDLEIIDVTVTGSNANYTWTKYSDLDLHLIVPGTPTESERELYSAKKRLWSEQHTVTIRALPVECYIQGEDEPHHSTGVYSVTKKRWLITPKKIKPAIDDAAIEAKKEQIMREIEAALLSQDLSRLEAVKDKVTKMRRAGLERAGEWSVENLVFKLLRNLGIIEQITEKIRELEDAQLSLEQQDNLLD